MAQLFPLQIKSGPGSVPALLIRGLTDVGGRLWQSVYVRLAHLGENVARGNDCEAEQMFLVG